MTTAIGGNAVITATGAGVATGVVTDSTSNFIVGRDAVITAQSTDGAEAFGIDGGAAITGSAKVTVSSLAVRPRIIRNYGISMDQKLEQVVQLLKSAAIR